jgi:hypothetical protein
MLFMLLSDVVSSLPRSGVLYHITDSQDAARLEELATQLEGGKPLEANSRQQKDRVKGPKEATGSDVQTTAPTGSRMLRKDSGSVAGCAWVAPVSSIGHGGSGGDWGHSKIQCARLFLRVQQMPLPAEWLRNLQSCAGLATDQGRPIHC